MRSNALEKLYQQFHEGPKGFTLKLTSSWIIHSIANETSQMKYRSNYLDFNQRLISQNPSDPLFTTEKVDHAENTNQSKPLGSKQ